MILTFVDGVLMVLFLRVFASSGRVEGNIHPLLPKACCESKLTAVRFIFWDGHHPVVVFFNAF